MLLVIDVGNTNIVFGVYEERLLYDWRIATEKIGPQMNMVYYLNKYLNITVFVQKM